MTDRKTGKQTVETILSALEGEDFKTVNQISEKTGLSYETVERWLEIIKLVFASDRGWHRDLQMTQVGKFKGYRLKVN